MNEINKNDIIDFEEDNVVTKNRVINIIEES